MRMNEDSRQRRHWTNQFAFSPILTPSSFNVPIPFLLFFSSFFLFLFLFFPFPFPFFLFGSAVQKNGICEVLYAAAYVTGEFAEHLDDPLPVLEALLQPRVASLPGHIQSVYVHNALKLYAAFAKKVC